MLFVDFVAGCCLVAFRNLLWCCLLFGVGLFNTYFMQLLLRLFVCCDAVAVLMFVLVCVLFVLIVFLLLLVG